MSTPALIGRRTEDGGWEARRHHFEGYPSRLGDELWYQLQIALRDGHEVGPAIVMRTLIDEHPAGWSTILDADWALEPGFVNHDQPKSSRRIQCYCHGDRAEPQDDLFTDKDPPGGAEFCYIVDLLGRAFEILANPDNCWVSLGLYPFEGDEPDWARLDRGVEG